MYRTFVVGLALFAVGCGSSEPKKVEININGQPLPMVLEEPKKENDPVKAADLLAKQKAKWLDESGELKEAYRKGTSNKLMAHSSFENIFDNHPETPAGKEAQTIAAKLQ